jgi:hypothetical protein
MNRKISSFVDSLAQVSLPSVFNPYADLCPVFDRNDANVIRMRNLKQALNRAVDVGATSVWVAQDLGYRGGRRTGLALTDEAHLAQHGLMLQAKPFTKATNGPVVVERTAEIVWHALGTIGKPVLLWNVFPLHPHLPGDPLSNRCHTKTERLLGLEFLQQLFEILRPELVVSIGLQAEKALRQLDVSCERARHPSYGGQREFLNSINSLYGCSIRLKSESGPEMPFLDFNE